VNLLKVISKVGQGSRGGDRDTTRYAVSSKGYENQGELHGALGQMMQWHRIFPNEEDEVWMMVGHEWLD
jgi:hypothetical protein